MEHPFDEKTLSPLMKRIGYDFENPALLAEAFRHSSYVNELGSDSVQDNERLEFLGDAVLDLAISHILMDLFCDAREGDLSKFRAAVVNEKTLSQIARTIDLGAYLLLGKGEEITGGRRKASILADTMEALLGALYLDAGYEKTKAVIARFFKPLLCKMDSAEEVDDFKSLLQELTQATLKTRPVYQITHESGPAHQKRFRIALRLGGEVMAEAEGKSKKEAEQKAARETFYCLKQESEDH